MKVAACLRLIHASLAADAQPVRQLQKTVHDGEVPSRHCTLSAGFLARERQPWQRNSNVNILRFVYLQTSGLPDSMGPTYRVRCSTPYGILLKGLYGTSPLRFWRLASTSFWSTVSGVVAKEKIFAGGRRRWACAVSFISRLHLRKNCYGVLRTGTYSCLRVHSGLMKRGSEVGSNSLSLPIPRSYSPEKPAEK